MTSQFSKKPASVNVTLIFPQRFGPPYFLGPRSVLRSYNARVSTRGFNGNNQFRDVFVIVQILEVTTERQFIGAVNYLIYYHRVRLQGNILRFFFSKDKRTGSFRIGYLLGRKLSFNKTGDIFTPSEPAQPKGLHWYCL